MTEVLLRVLVVAFVAAVIVAVAVIVRNARRGPGLAMMFAPKPAKRIDIVEQVSIDAKRKLILVRRDDVEHLVMTGGPVDIVIESGIAARATSGDTRKASSPNTLPPHVLGQAAE
jgi:flagellar protein FliO/FliZ